MAEKSKAENLNSLLLSTPLLLPIYHNKIPLFTRTFKETFPFSFAKGTSLRALMLFYAGLPRARCPSIHCSRPSFLQSYLLHTAINCIPLFKLQSVHHSNASLYHNLCQTFNCMGRLQGCINRSILPSGMGAWSKLGARGEHGDVLWFSTEVFSGSPI